VCTPQEAEMLRRRLRQVGIQAFVRETIGTGEYSARKLCSVFRLQIPPFLEDGPDESLYELLSLAMIREHSKRLRLPQYRTIDDAVKLLQTSQNIMVITGAGVSLRPDKLYHHPLNTSTDFH
jgi:NAD-dependent histone deacetylase SIR2